MGLLTPLHMPLHHLRAATTAPHAALLMGRCPLSGQLSICSDRFSVISCKRCTCSKRLCTCKVVLGMSQARAAHASSKRADNTCHCILR